MNILETNHLTFNYRNHSVLEDINLKIPEGSIYGYLGKNGEGKSTTIKILLGLEQTPKNTVFFNKKEFHSNRSYILQNIGCLVEQPFFYADLSAYENLNYLDMLYRCGQKRIKEVLELVNLTKDKDKKVRKYSTGMKQRLGIAMAMFHNPKLLTKVSHPNKYIKNNSLSNFLCKLVIAKELILKTKQQNCYGSKNRENKRVIQTFEC